MPIKRDYKTILPNTTPEIFDNRLLGERRYIFSPLRENDFRGKVPGEETYRVYRPGDKHDLENCLAMVFARQFKVNELLLNVMRLYDNGEFIEWFADWLKFFYGVDLEGAEEADSTQEKPQPPTELKPKTRGMKIGTAERVTEFHRLVKNGISFREAKDKAHCDPSTYYLWCKQVTGEESITPYR